MSRAPVATIVAILLGCAAVIGLVNASGAAPTAATSGRTADVLVLLTCSGLAAFAAVGLWRGRPWALRVLVAWGAAVVLWLGIRLIQVEHARFTTTALVTLGATVLVVVVIVVTRRRLHHSDAGPTP